MVQARRLTLHSSSRCRHQLELLDPKRIVKESLYNSLYSWTIGLAKVTIITMAGSDTRDGRVAWLLQNGILLEDLALYMV
jgi:hypothetical protein